MAGKLEPPSYEASTEGAAGSRDYPGAEVATAPTIDFTIPLPAVQVQPGRAQVQWMQSPTQAVPDCPPGLEYLALVDQVLVHQIVEVLELLTGFETNNKYSIKNSLGQQVFFAVEGMRLPFLHPSRFFMVSLISACKHKSKKI